MPIAVQIGLCAKKTSTTTQCEAGLSRENLKEPKEQVICLGSTMEAIERVRGSSNEFDEDWRKALSSSDSRYLIYPSRDSQRQADLIEWIKAQQIEAILKEAHIHSGRVLEYGAGAAGISLYLAERGHDAHICDLSPYALQVAQRNQATHANEVSLTSAIVANTLQLPYATNSFDVVMSYGLLEHFELASLHQLLDETIRVLRPGGLFVADIVPGPERFNVRTLGMMVNYIASAGMHLLTGKWHQLPSLYQQYFEHYYESSYDSQRWTQILNEHDIEQVKVDVCRPFPPLAVSGLLENVYTNIMRRFLPFHQRFDGANNWFTTRWGWMYLASARKQVA